MSFAKFTRAATLLAVLLFAATSVVLADDLSYDLTATGVTFNGVTHDLSSISKYTYISFSMCTVSGSGLTIAGKTRDSMNVNDAGVSYKFTGGSITATIHFMNTVVPNSAYRFFDSTIWFASSSTDAFVFETDPFVSNTTITFTGLQASWPAATPVASLVSSPKGLSMNIMSAIFIEQCTVTNAASILSVPPFRGNGLSIGTGSVVAIDQSKCVNCGTALVYVAQDLSVSDSSLFRVRLCDAGAKPLVSHVLSVGVMFNSLYAVTDSSSTGALFSPPANSFTVTMSSTATFRNLTGGSTGLSSSNAIPVYTTPDSYVYGDSACVFGGATMTSAATFASNGLNVTSYISSTTCNAAECIPGASSGASGSDRNSCKCTCSPSTFHQGYCTYSSDPLYKHVECSSGFTMINGVCVSCNVDYCDTCIAPDRCDGCNSGYSLVNDKCVVCQPAGCQQCSAGNACHSCKTDHTYTFVNGECYICDKANCAACSADNVCQTCRTGYQLVNGQCYLCDIDNCLACSADNVCQMCKTDHTYTLVNGKCYISNIANCTTWGADNVCSQCNSGYSLVNGKCVFIPCNISGCLQCSADNGCSQCQSHLDLSADHSRCVCRGNCATCTADNVCQTCLTGFTLQSGNVCTRVGNAAYSLHTTVAALVCLAAALALVS